MGTIIQQIVGLLVEKILEEFKNKPGIERAVRGTAEGLQKCRERADGGRGAACLCGRGPCPHAEAGR